MTAKKSKKEDVTKKIASLSLNDDANTHTQSTTFYVTRKDTDKINFARLEKGLLLFIYIYETSKGQLRSEVALWDHTVCVNIIKDGQCTKLSSGCFREHNTNYRQQNICPYWYINNSCKFGSNCKLAHSFEDIGKYHRFIRTEPDVHVFQLIRFIRNFAGHFIDSAITDSNVQQDLYKDIIVVMVHLVHILSPKQPNSIEHLSLFLEATTINQLIAGEDLLVALEKPYEVPEVFFDLNMNFNTYWYQRNRPIRCINFNQLSFDFIAFFNTILRTYYEGRLKSRGAKAPWDRRSVKS